MAGHGQSVGCLLMNLPPILQSVLHLFLPHHCAGCGSDVISEKQVLCLRCQSALPFTGFHLHQHNPVEKIFWGRMPVNNAASLLYFTKDSLLQQLIHQLKYRGNKEIGHYFGEKIGEAIRQSKHFNGLDALVPLPLYAARERKRGYNQAAVVCEGIASTTQLPILKKVITRVKATAAQTHKRRTARFQNMEGKFRLRNAAAIQQKHILLVDDVVTTGATLEACGQTLLAAGNVQISIFTIAFTLK